MAGPGTGPTFDVTLATLTAATAGTTTSSDQTNGFSRGVVIGINITSQAVGSLTVTVQGKDVASGTYYTILASAALSSVAFTPLYIYPALTASSNSIANQVLPATWRISMVVSAGATITATIGASVIG